MKKMLEKSKNNKSQFVGKLNLSKLKQRSNRE